eukprot:6480458-Amphidinium_carterae.2
MDPASSSMANPGEAVGSSRGARADALGGDYGRPSDGPPGRIHRPPAQSGWSSTPTAAPSCLGGAARAKRRRCHEGVREHTPRA